MAKIKLILNDESLNDEKLTNNPIKAETLYIVEIVLSNRLPI